MALLSLMPGRRIVLALWAMLILVLALSVTPWVVGSFLGDDYVGEQTVVIARSPEAVWAGVADYERNPVNSSAVLRVLPLDPEGGLPAWEEEMNKNSATVRTLELDEGRRVVREVESLDGLMVARWELELAPSGKGCEVHLRQEVHISASGMIGAHLRFVMRFLNNAEVGPRLYLTRLAQELEAEGATE